MHGRIGSQLLLVKVAPGLRLALFVHLFTTNSVYTIAQGQDPVISLRVLRRPSIDNFLLLVFKDNFNFDDVWRHQHSPISYWLLGLLCWLGWCGLICFQHILLTFVHQLLIRIALRETSRWFFERTGLIASLLRIDLGSQHVLEL